MFVGAETLYTLFLITRRRAITTIVALHTKCCKMAQNQRYSKHVTRPDNDNTKVQNQQVGVSFVFWYETLDASHSDV
jgi:hypothetical protein